MGLLYGGTVSPRYPLDLSVVALLECGTIDDATDSTSKVQNPVPYRDLGDDATRYSVATTSSKK